MTPTEAGAEQPAAPPGQADAAAAAAASTPEPQAASGEVVSEVVEEEGMIEPQAASGETEPAAAEAEDSTEPQGASGDAPSDLPEGEAQPQPGALLVYSDSTYGFRVSYPSDFVVRVEPPEKLAPLAPQPVAAYAFMNPAAAASDVAELELPDLQIRVHPAAGAATLEEWLGNQGFLAEGNLPPEPYQTAAVPGLKVCLSTMIVPNCSYFFFGNGWVYQLVPASSAGQAIMDSFALLS